MVLVYTYSALLVTSHCTLHKKDTLDLHMLAHRFCFSRIRVHGTGGGGWGHPQGDMHMVAARLGCESHGRVGHSSPDCIDRLTNTTLTL